MVTCSLGSLFDMIDVPAGQPNTLDRLEMLEGIKSITLKWKIGKIVRCVREAFNLAINPRQEILSKYGTQAEQTLWNIPKENMEGYLTEINQLRVSSIELVVEPLEISALDGTNIIVPDLMKLIEANLIIEEKK